MDLWKYLFYEHRSAVLIIYAAENNSVLQHLPFRRSAAFTLETLLSQIRLRLKKRMQRISQRWTRSWNSSSSWILSRREQKPASTLQLQTLLKSTSTPWTRPGSWNWRKWKRSRQKGWWTVARESSRAHLFLVQSVKSLLTCTKGETFTGIFRNLRLQYFYNLLLP